MYDTIIIGAGMSGLAAGVRLAHYNRRVCILERHASIGGLNSFYRRGGRNIDVGLHAMTNFTPKGARTGPLARLLRQLRIAWDELRLAQQLGSAVMFPGISLRFTNQYEMFESEVHRHFPREKDRFRDLVQSLLDYNHLGHPDTPYSAREIVREKLKDPLLVEMLFCPILYYGGARERDIDFGQFSILFRSIFMEGLARPWEGVRLILRKFVEKFKAMGGELRTRAGVSRIVVKDGKAQKVILEDGSELEAENIISSAGWQETMRLCDGVPMTPEADPGRLTFVEAISILDRSPQQLGYDKTIVFYNDSERFEYARPNQLVDVRSGTICCPGNFAFDQPLPDPMIRVTSLASYDRWTSLNEEEYQLAKLKALDRMNASIVRFIPDFRHTVVDTDVFTPLTIRRYTGHEGGAVYGSTQKRYDGTTPVNNLFLCGNDQGYVGIVGTILSGIGIANRYMLKA